MLQPLYSCHCHNNQNFHWCDLTHRPPLSLLPAAPDPVAALSPSPSCLGQECAAVCRAGRRLLVRLGHSGRSIELHRAAGGRRRRPPARQGREVGAAGPPDGQPQRQLCTVAVHGSTPRRAVTPAWPQRKPRPCRQRVEMTVICQSDQLPAR